MMLEFRPDSGEHETWAKIQGYSRLYGIVLFAIALGALGQSIIDKSDKLPWLHAEAATAQHLQKVVPKLADAAGCQTARANEASAQLKNSLTNGNVNLDKIPTCPTAPKLKK